MKQCLALLMAFLVAGPAAAQEATNYAVIRDDTIVNIVLWDGSTPFEIEGATLIALPDGAAIGWVRDGESWADPTPPEPEPAAPLVIDAWRFWAIVDLTPGLKAQIDTAIASLPTATERAVVRARLDHTDAYRRDDPLFDELGAVIGLAPEAIDALFAQAAELEG